MRETRQGSGQGTLVIALTKAHWWDEIERTSLSHLEKLKFRRAVGAFLRKDSEDPPFGSTVSNDEYANLAHRLRLTLDGSPMKLEIQSTIGDKYCRIIIAPA
jgi:hypothetical protein